MNILFISLKGQGLGLAKRCSSEGYQTDLHIEDDASILAGSGIVDSPMFSGHLINRSGECIASNAKQLLSETKPDLIVFDGERVGKVADYFREQNLPVFGNCYWSDCLSSRNGYVNNILRRVGVEKWKGEEGMKVDVGVWWNGLCSLFPFVVFNEDRFMNDSLGPHIDSAGNVVKGVEGKLVDESIYRLERLLKKTKFRGLISVSLVVTRTKIYAISFTTSFLYLPSLLEIYKGSVTDLLMSVANGRKPEGEFTTDYALSLLLSIPPFPASVASLPKSPIKGVSPSNLKHLYLMNVCKDGGGYESAGIDSALMWVSARGRTIGEARKRVFSTVSNISVDSVQYRTDMTTEKKILRDEEKLLGWGYLKS